MKTTFKITLLLSLFFLNSCSGENDAPFVIPPVVSNPPEEASYKYLALGDSYTIGQNVCVPCRFPEQLTTRLSNETDGSFYLKIIAETGWTTSNLISAVNNQTVANDYDLVTVLIGVNNQYIHRPFSEYEQQFEILINKAIGFAKGDKANVIVVSIPDYAYTPFGQNASNPVTISTEIDQYNTFARNYCAAHDIVFVDITDITRRGLEEPQLVATDGLHPSQTAYSLFVDRIFPKAMTALMP